MNDLIRGKTHIVDIDGSIREKPDFPTALIRRSYTVPNSTGAEDAIYPVFTDAITRNLYGRMMTLVEATTEPSRLKAVKDVFAKELSSWEKDIYEDASDLCFRALEYIDVEEDSKK